ncbi:MAG: PEP-CTERM sorting domain-containing protein [Chlorobia bacterium]|nr:PEP-CTERM sorting domain-containing protein [Fimbriimonadaceae bacterium]
MKYRSFITVLSSACIAGVLAPGAFAQSPSSLYSWDGAVDIDAWVKNFGAGGTSATLDNNTAGKLTIIETSGTAGGSQAFSDGANRVRELPSAASGGLDLTGLTSLEWIFGHNGSAPVNVQFFVQASTGFNYVALGPDLAIAPGISTYTVPLTGLTPDQLVYIRTLGINVRDHAAQGNLTWTIENVSSGGTPLSARDLITHNTGTPEGGLQGAIANFDLAAIQGNNGGQNQSGLSHNASGSGSLQWTDLGGSNGAAVSWGNGTAWNGNTFNNRTTDLSNYVKMIVRMSATDASGGGGTLGVGGFFQKNNFAFEGAGTANLTIDGQFHDLEFSLIGLSNMSVVDLTGINLFSHAQNLVINVDNVRFEMAPVPEPASMAVFGLGALALLRRRQKQS